MKVDLLEPSLATQILLGQRRTQIRALGLGTNQHHPPLEALLAQRLRGLGAGQARASDDEYLLAHLILSRGHV